MDYLDCMYVTGLGREWGHKEHGLTTQEKVDKELGSQLLQVSAKSAR